MGNEQSALSDGAAGQGVAYGFHVLRNTSTAEVLKDIEPWYDFIVGINGRQIDDPDPNMFIQEIQNCAGHSVRLWVWSAKGQRIQDIMISLPPGPVSLGLTLQWTPLSITENVWHILEIADGSPAYEAGLLEYSDYIVGTPEGIVRGESALGELIAYHQEKPLRLYVYNSQHNVTRELTLTPRHGWGGEGLLGCVLGFGALHRLPAPLSEPLQEPGEMLFDASGGPPPAAYAQPAPPHAEDGFTEAKFEGTGGFVTAASLAPQFAPPPMGGSVGTHGRKTQKKPRRAGFTMEDLLKEGEEKSRELDAAAGGIPEPSHHVGPPPKASIPPPPRRAGS